MDARLFFVCGRPIFGLFLSLIYVGADKRRTRACSPTPVPGPAGLWHVGLPPLANKQHSPPASFVTDATAHFCSDSSSCRRLHIRPATPPLPTTRNMSTSDLLLVTLEELVIDLCPFQTNWSKAIRGLQTLNYNDHFGQKGRNFLTRNGHKADNTRLLPYF